MTASNVAFLLLASHATLCVAIIVVLAARKPVRRIAGARIAYALWLVPPVAALAWLLPARQMVAQWPGPHVPEAVVNAAKATMLGGLNPLAALALLLWLLGGVGMVALFVWRQRRFVESAGDTHPAPAFGTGVVTGSSATGPAVVGVLWPVIVLPSDFAERFMPHEQALILEHERMHLQRRDPLVNAVVLAVQATNWFNPLIHIAARALRADQEMACDAAVLARNAAARRAYGEAMLKSHAPAYALPAGCAWRSPAFYPLKERILMLSKSAPSRLRRRIGMSFVLASTLVAGGAIWLVRPADVRAAQAAVPTTALSQNARAAVELAKLNARQMAACKAALAARPAWDFWKEDYGASALRTLVCIGLPVPARGEATPQTSN